MLARRRLRVICIQALYQIYLVDADVEEVLKFDWHNRDLDSDDIRFCKKIIIGVIENKDKISEDDAKNIQTEIDNTKKAVESEDVEQIKSAMEALSQASHKLSEVMYQQAAQEQQAQQQAQAEQPDAAETQEKSTLRLSIP